jgi:hypothetical protein
VNLIILRSPKIKFFSDDEKYITEELMIQSLTSYLIDKNENMDETSFEELFQVIPSLAKGLNINIKFTK